MARVRSRGGTAQVPGGAGKGGEPGESPIVLVARRGRIRGRLAIENLEEMPVRRLEAKLEGIELRGVMGERIEMLRMVGRIPPGRRGELAAVLTIDPLTPPGTYAGTLLVGEQGRPVSIVVPEERLVRLVPSTLWIDSGPGEEIERTVTLENRGNAPVVVNDPDPVVLEALDRMHTLVRRAVERTEVADFDALLDSLVGRAQELVASDRDRLIIPSLVGAPIEVPPGRTAVLQLRFKVPRQLDGDRRFRARLNIAGESLMVEVHRLRPRERAAAPVREGG